MRPFRTAFLILACAATLFSCAKKETLSPEEQLRRDAVVQTGNTYRFMKAVQKAEEGGTVTIAYLGGSITQGSSASPEATMCYARQSYDAFCSRFDLYPGAVNYVNAGIGATNSLVGIERCEADIISQSPDIVFVEFAVNDNGSHETANAYESIVRRLLNAPSEPAVILIFTMNDQGWNCEGTQKKVGYDYDLGMISVRSAIYQRMRHGEFDKDGYFSPDGLHPNTAGHTLIADFIDCYFDLASKKKPDESYQLPQEPTFDPRYEHLVSAESSDGEGLTFGGEFRYVPLKSWNWRHAWLVGPGGDGSLSVTLEAKDVILVYLKKGTGNAALYGEALLSVDGGEAQVLNGRNAEQWDGCAEVVAVTGETAQVHTLDISLAEGSGEKQFALLGIAYTE